MLLGFGYLVPSQLPGEGLLPLQTSRLFFLVVFFFIPFFSAPGHARSPARRGRIAWFLLFSLSVALGAVAVLKATGIEGVTIWGFILWKGLAAGGIAGAAAMTSAYWTLAREAAATDRA